MKKTYFLIVLFLCGLSVGNVFAAAPAADRLGQKLIDAAEAINEPEVERLITAGADVNAADQHGYTALIWAAAWGDVGIAELLLDAGADKDIKNKFDRTAEAIARANGHEDLANTIRDYVPSGRSIKSAGKTG